MARHRMVHPSQTVDLPAAPEEEGPARHRRSPQRARHLTVVALAGVVAGGALASTVDLPSAAGLPSSRPGADDRPPPPVAVPPSTDRAPDRSPPGRDAAPPPTAGPVTTPAPAADAPKTTAPDAPVWRADGPSAFRSTPWNTVRTGPPRVDGDVARFSVSGPYQRAELEPAVPRMREGDEYWFAFSVRLDEDFPAGGSSRQVITQWKNDSPGSAPVDMRVRNGRLVLHGGYGHPSGPRTFTKDVGPAPVGRWSEVMVRIRFSADPRRGSVSAWQDGEQEVHRYHPPAGTLYPGQSSYLKTGLDREPTITRPTEVAFRDWTVGPTQASVR